MRHGNGLTFAVLQVRDCTVAKDTRSPWRRVLGRHATLRAPRDPAACIFQVPTLEPPCPRRLQMKLWVLWGLDNRKSPPSTEGM